MSDDTTKIDVKCQHILLGFTGSVASIKAKLLIDLVKEKIPNCKIKTVCTESARHFLNEDSIKASGLVEEFCTQEIEWNSWKCIGDPVKHIELCKWADMFVLCPLDANTMAKISHGICDNILTCVARAWYPTKPKIYAPAMNTYMWNNPQTQKHIESLQELGYIKIDPITKLLACGDYGIGAMADVETIVDKIQSIIVNHVAGQE